jgi:hypothetical protein
MRVRIGTWATGDSVRSKGTVGWAGGEVLILSEEADLPEWKYLSAGM